MEIIEGIVFLLILLVLTIAAAALPWWVSLTVLQLARRSAPTTSTKITTASVVWTIGFLATGTAVPLGANWHFMAPLYWAFIGFLYGSLAVAPSLLAWGSWAVRKKQMPRKRFRYVVVPLNLAPTLVFVLLLLYGW